jgi:hypothetical protein
MHHCISISHQGDARWQPALLTAPADGGHCCCPHLGWLGGLADQQELVLAELHQHLVLQGGWGGLGKGLGVFRAGRHKEAEQRGGLPCPPPRPRMPAPAVQHPAPCHLHQRCQCGLDCTVGQLREVAQHIVDAEVPGLPLAKRTDRSQLQHGRGAGWEGRET